MHPPSIDTGSRWMPLLEDHTASFIVRIWRERGEGTAVCQEWRGSIEHVQTGQRSFFRDLGAIANFMQPHLHHLGIEAPLRFWDRMTPDLFAGEVGDGAEMPSVVPPVMPPVVPSNPPARAARPRKR
jgi:hypothetical protein